ASSAVSCCSGVVRLVVVGTVSLLCLIGAIRSCDRDNTVRLMYSRQSERNGHVNRVVPHGESRATAAALAREIAAFPARCVLSERRSVYESEGLALDAALAREFALGKATIDSGETREGAGRVPAGEGRLRRCWA